MHRIFYPFTASTLLLMLALLLGITTVEAQYARGNSPYSRYGFGDLASSMMITDQSMGGGMAATQRSYWNVNLVNPASLGQLHRTAFQVGLNYEHHALNEKSTGLSATANNGNLSYLSLAFPITKSWQVRGDTLRRGEPVQWGMGFSLMPYSSRSYDVSVVRSVGDIPNVNFNYQGNGNRYRINWSNGVTYKGLSVGANVGLLFGQVNDITSIDFQDSSYVFGYDEVFVTQENVSGLIWDIGAQYEYFVGKDDDDNMDEPCTGGNFRQKLIVGAYIGGTSDLTTSTDQETLIQGPSQVLTSLNTVTDQKGTIKMPLKYGGGISYGSEYGFKIGISYEGQTWSSYRVDGVADENLTNSWKIATGLQWVPDICEKNSTSYFNRVRYRFGAHYGSDQRIITAANGTAYQLQDYGVAMGAGFPIHNRTLKSFVGFVNLGLEFGYVGHPELIGDMYFKVNLGFALNASGWFQKSKFR